MDKIKIGKYLKALRETKGISQLTLANNLEEMFGIVGISTSTISKWEKGKSLPSIDNLKMLSQYYKVSLDAIFNGEVDLKDIVEHYDILIKNLYKENKEDYNSYISEYQFGLRKTFRNLLSNMLNGYLNTNEEYIFDYFLNNYVITSNYYIEEYTPLHENAEIKMHIKKLINDGRNIDEKLYDVWNWFSIYDMCKIDLTKEVIDKGNDFGMILSKIKKLSLEEKNCLLMSLLSIGDSYLDKNNFDIDTDDKTIKTMIKELIGMGAVINNCFRRKHEYNTISRTYNVIDRWEQEFLEKMHKKYYINGYTIVSKANDYFANKYLEFAKMLDKEHIFMDQQEIKELVDKTEIINSCKQKIKEGIFVTDKEIHKEVQFQLMYNSFDRMLEYSTYISHDDYKNGLDEELTQRILEDLTNKQLTEIKKEIFLV